MQVFTSMILEGYSVTYLLLLCFVLLGVGSLGNYLLQAVSGEMTDKKSSNDIGYSPGSPKASEKEEHGPEHEVTEEDDFEGLRKRMAKLSA